MNAETNIHTCSVEQMAELMSQPPAPADEVITLEREMAERVLGWLEEHPKLAGIALSTCEEVTILRQELAEPKIELWAIHSVGPGEVYPCMSKEHAEREAQELIEVGRKMKAERIAKGESVEHWHDWVVNVIPSPWEPAEHFEILAQETMENRDDLREYAKELEQKLANKPAVTLPMPVMPEQPEDAVDDSWMDGYNAALRMREQCLRAIEAAGMQAVQAAPAVVNQQVTTAATCDHEWTDDGQHLLVCTACGAQEDHDPRWRDMATAPRDGTLVRLLVEFTEHATEDADQAPTIGANNFENDGEDRWQFAGWCWSHDHFTQGKGEPIGWLPMLDEPRRIAASNDNAPWSPSGIDYDRSIHSNPDAKAWADMFVTTFPGLADKHELMIGWFANAMMAMHDFLKAQLSGAASDVLAERQRQITAEDFDAGHDDMATGGQLADAAACYALWAGGINPPNWGQFWPWDREWLKQSEPRRMLVKAGALILAEIERLDRAEQAKQQEQQP